MTDEILTWNPAEAAHNRYRRRRRIPGEIETQPSQGGETIRCGGEEYVILTNINGLVAAYRIKGWQLISLTDDEMTRVNEVYECRQSLPQRILKAPK
jgi:hypothetical protein